MEYFKTEVFAKLGKEIPILGVKYSGTVIDRLLRIGVSRENISKWIVHTGSRSILDDVGDSFGIQKRNMLESYEVLSDCGNLAGACLPFVLERVIRNGSAKSGSGVA